MTPLIEVRDLAFQYPGGVSALENVSFSVDKGERISVLGANGAGKSTLLLLLAGLREPSYGRVLISGTVMDRKNKNELRAKIGIIFQDPDDQIFMPTVEEDIAFGPINLGLKESDVQKRTNEAILATKLSGYEKRQPHHLSLGEKKRVALAGIIAMSPSILLLDEPTSGLDPAGKIEMMSLLERIGETIVLVTHDIDLALEFSDRTILLNRSVLFDGPTVELFENELLLVSNGLARPKISRIATVLRNRGLLKEGDRPRSMDELEKLLSERQ